jgi:hypothetical protein
MSNYFHDVATAMLLACGVVLRVLARNRDQEGDAVLRRYADDMHRSVNRLAWFSVVWIIAGGILRFATFRSFEWWNAVQKHLETALLVKYGIATLMMIAGAVLWMKYGKNRRRTAS